MLPASIFDRIYAPGTRQNHPGEPGVYRLEDLLLVDPGCPAQEIVEGAREREAFALLERQGDALLVARQLDHDLAMPMGEFGEVIRF